MIYISICLTLFVLLASLHLLAKVNKEGLGSFFKWGCYLIMLAATLILLCQVVRGVVMMRHHMMDHGNECCEGMNGGRMGCHDGEMREGNCCGYNSCHDGGKCEDEKGKCDDGKMKCEKDSSKSCCKDMKDEKHEKGEKAEKK